MKRRMFLWVALLGIVGFVSGCNKPTAPEVQSLTQAAVSVGFAAWSASTTDKTQVAKVAAQVNAGVIDALAYLNGNQGLASSVLNAAILAKLTANLPVEVQATIRAAAGILDEVLPAPSSSILNPSQIAYLTAFLQGVQSGVPTSAPATAKLKVDAVVMEWNKENKEFKGKIMVDGKSHDHTLKAGHWLNSK